LPVGPERIISERALGSQVLAAQPDGRSAVIWKEGDPLGAVGVVKAEVRDEDDAGPPPSEVTGSVPAVLLWAQSTPTGFIVAWYERFRELRIRELDAGGMPAGPISVVPPEEPILSARPVGGFVATRKAKGALEVQLRDHLGAPEGRPAWIKNRRIVLWDVAHRRDGSFLVIYYSAGSGAAPLAQWFSAEGRLQGKSFAVVPPGGALLARAVGATGTLGVLYNGPSAAAGSGLFLRTFDAHGHALGRPTRVLDQPAPTSYGQTLALDDAGDVLGVWLKHPATGAIAMARQYTAQGAPSGPAFVVSSALARPGLDDAWLQALATGDTWVVTWQRVDSSPPFTDQLLVRRFFVR
jgi:hypothetical protein